MLGRKELQPAFSTERTHMLKASVKALRGPFQSTAAMSRGVFRALSEQKRCAVLAHNLGGTADISLSSHFGAEVFFIWCKIKII